MRCSNGRVRELERVRVGFGTHVNIGYRREPGIEEQRETI